MNRSIIEKNLIGNGHLIAEAKRRQQSLSRADRAMIGRIRQEAINAGIPRADWNYLEMAGELGIKGIVGSRVTANFIGVQEISDFFKLRLYNIEGDHPQNGSTVSVMELVRQGIFPLDLTFSQIVKEYLREVMFHVWCELENVWYKVKKFLPLIVLAFLISGCHSLDRVSGKSDNPTPPAQAPHIQATWISDIAVDGSQLPFHMILEDKGNSNIEGIWNLNWAHTGEVQGTLTGNTFTFILGRGASCLNGYTGTGTIEGNQMTLSFSGPGCPGTIPMVPAVALAQGTILWNGQQ